jgi:hypothetical protein
MIMTLFHMFYRVYGVWIRMAYYWYCKLFICSNWMWKELGYVFSRL